MLKRVWQSRNLRLCARQGLYQSLSDMVCEEIVWANDEIQKAVCEVHFLVGNVWMIDPEYSPMHLQDIVKRAIL